MTNSFNGNDVATISLKIATEDLGLASHFYRDAETDFGAGSGSTVQVGIPGVTTVGTRAVGSSEDFVLGSVAESTTDVTLTTEAYAVVPVTLAENDLNLKNLTKQVIRPSALSVANHIDNAVAAVLSGVTKSATIAYDATSPKASVIRARAALRANGVSADMTVNPIRVLAGSTVYADMLLAEEIDNANGLDRIAGLPVYESTMIGADDLFVFIPSSIAVAIRAPRVPMGAALGGTSREGGMALSTWQALDAKSGTTLSTTIALLGVKALDLPVADYENGIVNMVPGGGMIAINTTGA
ncbi:hypothetical protein QQX09_12215 [Demequina sp. SYSU T00192]|uniref:Major capsid protein n=1 Tax=Demequina litoralis TaxID=3051660 RepID=A0ABT8GC36_9MICO|nr:hypothetical protein [Demequina sp. SYSU T00192]MDN4476622.1 hypothetical protein [Demequina sp. SYSU T00192]